MFSLCIICILFWPDVAATFDIANINGYYLETQNEKLNRLNEDPNAAVRPDALECPSENVITSTYRCQVSVQKCSTDTNRVHFGELKCIHPKKRP